MLRKAITQIKEVNTGKVVYESSDSLLVDSYVKAYCYKKKGKLFRLRDDAELEKKTKLIEVVIESKEVWDEGT